MKVDITPPVEGVVTITMTEAEARELWALLGPLPGVGIAVKLYSALDHKLRT